MKMKFRNGNGIMFGFGTKKNLKKIQAMGILPNNNSLEKKVQKLADRCKDLEWQIEYLMEENKTFQYEKEYPEGYNAHILDGWLYIGSVINRRVTQGCYQLPKGEWSVAGASRNGTDTHVYVSIQNVEDSEPRTYCLKNRVVEEVPYATYI